jgi:hypothetical protein
MHQFPVVKYVGIGNTFVHYFILMNSPMCNEYESISLGKISTIESNSISEVTLKKNDFDNFIFPPRLKETDW